jgi:hypothetical protein
MNKPLPFRLLLSAFVLLLTCACAMLAGDAPPLEPDAPAPTGAPATNTPGATSTTPATAAPACDFLCDPNGNEEQLFLMKITCETWEEQVQADNVSITSFGSSGATAHTLKFSELRTYAGSGNQYRVQGSVVYEIENDQPVFKETDLQVSGGVFGDGARSCQFTELDSLVATEAAQATLQPHATAVFITSTPAATFTQAAPPSPTVTLPPAASPSATLLPAPDATHTPLSDYSNLTSLTPEIWVAFLSANGYDCSDVLETAEMYSPDCVKEIDGIEYRATLVAPKKSAPFQWLEVNLQSAKPVPQALARQHFALLLDLIPNLPQELYEAWLDGLSWDNPDYVYQEIAGYTLGLEAGGDEVELYVKAR